MLELLIPVVLIANANQHWPGCTVATEVDYISADFISHLSPHDVTFASRAQSNLCRLDF